MTGRMKGTGDYKKRGDLENKRKPRVVGGKTSHSLTLVIWRCFQKTIMGTSHLEVRLMNRGCSVPQKPRGPSDSPPSMPDVEARGSVFGALHSALSCL